MRADSAARDLSGFAGPGQLFSVTITLDVPPATFAAGLEDAPPAGWIASKISNGGDWDELTDKIKWGPFFAPSIPSAVTYDISPPAMILDSCFAGTITIDIASEPIAGDQCVFPPVTVPAFAAPAAVGLTAIILATAVVALAHPRRHNHDPFCH
ncbi:MAG: hypothetical protein HOP29_10055 [Phycisphaerales bacterium]|nr:hypothetical protein [Phycisphaerales bacterium]